MSDFDDLLSALPPVRDDGFSAGVMRRIAREQTLLQMLVWGTCLLTALTVLAFLPLPQIGPALGRELMRVAMAPAVVMIGGTLALTWALWGYLVRE